MKGGLNGSHHSYELPNIVFVRIHRFNHADFYLLADGVGGKKNFGDQLARHFKNPSYITSIQKQYYSNSKTLLSLARQVKPTTTSLQRFFDYYSASTAMLDITASASKVVTDQLLQELNGHPNSEKIIAYYSTPQKLSPLQKLERDISSLIKTTPRDILIKKLHRRYQWIPINFVGEPWTEKEIAQKITAYRPTRHSTPTKAPSTHLSPTTKQHLHALRIIAELNEFRKGVFTKAIFDCRPAFDTLAKKNNLSGWEDINFLTTSEIIDLSKGKNTYQKALLPTRSLVLLAPKGKNVMLLYGNEVKRFEKKFRSIDHTVTELKGVTAQHGLVTGRVKIIKEVKDFAKFQKGDILVAKMTSIDFIAIMKRAAAFVTDEGGLACHAAIIAREYGTPCIVGTGSASHVFKDGDLVKVDANLGIISKIIAE